MTKSLWPEDIGQTNEIGIGRILGDQASFLMQRVSSKFSAEVDISASGSQILYRFVLISHAVGNFRLVLFIVVSNIKNYPATVYAEHLPEGQNRFTVTGESDLENTLKIIFFHDETRKVISAFIAQNS